MKYAIPTTDIVITCRNKREESLARIFINQMEDVVEWAIASDDPHYWARRVVDADGWDENYIRELDGQSSAMYWLGMVGEPITMTDIHNAIMAMYAAGIESAADEDDAAAAYMDTVKADAAYCLGIEYGSDEWYALADI